MSDYETGFQAGRSAGTADFGRAAREYAENLQQRRYQQGINDAFQNQANQYQNLLNKFNDLVADYNNLVERFNLRGEQIMHAENAFTHAENQLALKQDQINILEKGFRYQAAAHALLMQLPYLATTAEDNPGGLDDELRERFAKLQELPNGEQEYQKLIAHIAKVGRSIADDSVLAEYLKNEVQLLQVSTRVRDPKAWILQCAENRQYLRARVHNPMPVSWPDREETLLKLMDTAMRITEATQERRFMDQFYRILVVRLLNAIFGHMAQGRDSTEPEPVAAAFQEAMNSDVFPFFPEKRRVHFGSTLRENVFDKDGNSLGTYGDWLRNSFARVLSGMDELYLLRQGNLQALQSLIPQASNLDLQSSMDQQTPVAPEKKVANGNGPVWGNPVTPQEQGNPWVQSVPAPKPAESAKKPQEPLAGSNPAGMQPPRSTWGDPSPS